MPALAFQNVNLAHIALTLAVGLTFVIYVAWTQREASWRISTFFVGGRNIGAPLTAQTYWGSSFSFANGIIYFAVLGNLYGLSVIWFQIPWVCGVWFLAWRLPQLIRITDKYTLHGFLGSLYGRRVRIAASIVTIAGFMGFFAYEVVISVDVVSGVLGLNTGMALLAIVVAVYVAAHADVGGYLGTARTDRVQNLLGMIAVILVIYYLVAFPNNLTNKGSLSLQKMAESFSDVASIPWPIWLGVLCFAPFINIVDMSHWQSISANTAASQKDIGTLRWAIVKSSMWMLVFPAATGAFIGYAWRGVNGITDTNLLPAAIAGVPGTSGELAGFVGGFVILGLLAVGFSSASGYLLASIQTASWDLRHYETIFRDGEHKLEDDDQRSIVLESRVILYVFAISSVLLFIAARHLAGDVNILPLQFVLVAVVVSLVPATFFGLWLNHRNRTPKSSTSTLMMLSIAVGFIAGLAVYFKPLGGDLNNVFQWAPVMSLSFSFAFSLVAVVCEFYVRPAKADIPAPSNLRVDT